MNRYEAEEEGYTEVFAWGADRYGQLGLGNKQGGRCYCIPRYCSFNVVITAVACGEEHSAFITDKGQLFTVGSNSEGRLGVGDRGVLQSSTPCLVEALSKLRSVQVACGWGHTAVVLDNGDLYTWGVGEYGALGLPEQAVQWLPVQVRFGEKMRTTAVSVSCGTRHTAIVDDKGRLFVCGSNEAGQLGIGSRQQELQPCLLSSIPEKIEQAACGVFHTVILTKTGRVYVTGGNTFGQLGTGNKRASGVPVKLRDLEDRVIVKVAAGHHSAALSDNGELFIWGTGVFGELLLPTSLSKLAALSTPILEVAIGGCFGAAIDKDGTVYTWGSNTSGELGLGDYDSRSLPYPIRALEGKTVTKISCGGTYAIALGQTIRAVRPRASLPPAKASAAAPLPAPPPASLSAPFPLPPPPPPPPPAPAQASAGMRERLSAGTRQTEDSKQNVDQSVFTQTIRGTYSHDVDPLVDPDVPSPTRTWTRSGVGIGGEEKHDTRMRGQRESVSEELVEAIKSEKRKKQALQTQFDELTVANTALVAKDKANSQAETTEIATFKEQLLRVESEINNEKDQCFHLFKELEEEQSKVNRLDSAKSALDGKIASLEREIQILKDENLRMRGERNTQTTGESSKLNELLKEYEEKIQREIKERERITQEKEKEIVVLSGIRNKLKLTIADIHQEQTKAEEYHREELHKIADMIEQYKSRIAEEEDATVQLKSLHTDQLAQAREIQETLERSADRKRDLNARIESNNNVLQKLHQNFLDEKQELLQAETRNKEVEGLIAKRQEELRGLQGELEKQETQKQGEADNVKRSIEDKVYDNEELQNQINIRQVEIDGLQKDVLAWKQVADNIRGENEHLLHVIEVLEGKNRTLLASLNAELQQRAIENEERTAQAIKLSQSPLRIQKILAQGPKPLLYAEPSSLSATLSPLTKPKENLSASMQSGKKGQSQAPPKTTQQTLVKALETYATEEPADTGRPLDAQDKPSDPYVQERQLLKQFETETDADVLASVDTGSRLKRASVSPLPPPSDDLEQGRRGGGEKVTSATKKLVKVLGTESPIRKRVANEYLSPSRIQRPSEEEVKPQFHR